MRRGPKKSPVQIKIQHRRVNEQIHVNRVRLIGAQGESFGILSRDEAMQKAHEAGLDLVEISPNSHPPVCKIIDYRKFLFEEEKKAKEAKKKQKSTQLKEIKFRPNTDEHDYNFKLNHIRKFLEKGNKVKVTIWFRGRQMAHKEFGYQIIDRLKNDLQEFGALESDPQMEGRFLVAFFAPKSK